MWHGVRLGGREVREVEDRTEVSSTGAWWLDMPVTDGRK